MSLAIIPSCKLINVYTHFVSLDYSVISVRGSAYPTGFGDTFRYLAIPISVYATLTLVWYPASLCVKTESERQGTRLP